MLTSLNNADKERRKLDHNEQCGTACLQDEFASTRRRVPEAVGFGDLQPHVNLGTCPADLSTGDQSRGGRGGYVGTPAIPGRNRGLFQQSQLPPFFARNPPVGPVG